jgi:hypothetical protein
VSCDNSVSSKEPEPGKILPGEGAHVRIMLPPPISGEARSISLETARQITDFYQVTFKRTDTATPEYFSADASSSDSYIELRIPVGQYDILLFAGHSGEDRPVLLVSAYKQEQDIILEGINIIILNLKLVEFDLVIPSLIEAGSVFEANLHINFHNPFIDYSSGSTKFRYITRLPSMVSPEVFSDETFLVENSSFNSLTGVYTFARLFEALDVDGNGVIYADTSKIKPFGYDNTPVEWALDGHWSPGISNNYRAFFDFKIPEAQINILWPEE